MFKKYKTERTVRAPPNFGEDIRNQEFHLDPAVTFMNCGSRGVTPKQVLAELQRKTDQVEYNNDWYWFFDKYIEHPAATQVLADFFSCDVKDISFVANTTRGVNNMIKTVNFGPGEAILQNNWTYEMVLNVNAIVARDKDHIASMPAVLFPVREVIDLCHQHGALVLVDGAHAVRQVDVNLSELGADFYCGNTNKWMFGPKNCAFQWVSPAFHDSSEPVVTSFDPLDGFPENMFYQGTMNEAPYLVYPAAYNFYNWIGGLNAITTYNVGLMEEGMALLLEAWQTPKFPIPSEMEAPFLRMAIIPDTLAYPKTREGAIRLRDDLAERFHVMTATSGNQDELSIRISVQVFVVLDDFVRLRDAVMILKDEEPDNPQQLASKAKKHTSGPNATP